MNTGNEKEKAGKNIFRKYVYETET